MGDMADWVIDNGMIPWDGMMFSDEEREVIELSERGMSVSAIGAKLDLPVSDVCAILSAAKQFKRGGGR